MNYFLDLLAVIGFTLRVEYHPEIQSWVSTLIPLNGGNSIMILGAVQQTECLPKSASGDVRDAAYHMAYLCCGNQFKITNVAGEVMLLGSFPPKAVLEERGW